MVALNKVWGLPESEVKPAEDEKSVIVSFDNDVNFSFDGKPRVGDSFYSSTTLLNLRRKETRLPIISPAVSMRPTRFSRLKGGSFISLHPIFFQDESKAPEVAVVGIKGSYRKMHLTRKSPPLFFRKLPWYSMYELKLSFCGMQSVVLSTKILLVGRNCWNVFANILMLCSKNILQWTLTSWLCRSVAPTLRKSPINTNNRHRSLV